MSLKGDLRRLGIGIEGGNIVFIGSGKTLGGGDAIADSSVTGIATGVTDITGVNAEFVKVNTNFTTVNDKVNSILTALRDSGIIIT